MIAAESLVALRELLTAVQAGESSHADVADNRPFQEEGHETIRTTGGDAMESAANRHARSGDSGATETGAGPDGVAGPGGPPDEHGCKPSSTGGSKWTQS